jgi:heme exporter protein B
MLLRARMREVLLPVILYPILVPVLMAGSKGTAALFEHETSVALFWAQFLLVFDAIFLTVALWAFESLVIE